MERIEAACVRNEYKLWIFQEYLLPSKRFLLTVHTLTSTQLSKLDTLADKYNLSKFIFFVRAYILYNCLDTFL